jgi:hypothetical protein
LLLVADGAHSQQTTSAELYWVVETNIRYRNYSIVRFYNQNDVQVHEVKINGVYINIRKPKQKRKLDQLVKEYNERMIASSKKNKSKPSI